ncbi:MAG: transposase [Bacteroidales bacterium]|nr:transposase [Bacteroidales bacterium]
MYFRTVENAAETHQEFVTKEQYDKLLFEYEYLKQQLADLKRMIFGSKSERFVASDDTQLSLFDIKEEQAPEPEKTEVSYQRQKPAKEKRNPIRVALPAHLPRVEEIIEPEGVEENDRKIGEEITEILEYNPAHVYVRKIIRPKYVKADKHSIVIAELPSFPIPKGNAGPGLLAWLHVSKFIDHLPFYRQIEIIKRQGLTLSDSTVNGWFNAAIRLMKPLYDTLEKQLLTH